MHVSPILQPNLREVAPSPFSPTIPTFQLAWDSTSLGLLKDCPRKYQLSILLQWSPKSKSHHLTFGGLYASGVERYAHLRARGLPHDDTVLGVVRWVLEASGSRGEGGEWLPWDSRDSLKNRYTLVRTLVWNFEDRLGSPFKTLILANGRPAVELSFNFPVWELDGETISLCGHFDEVVVLDDKVLVKDDKTTQSALTAQYWSRYTPDNQMSQYNFAGKIVLGQPIAGVLVRAAQIGVNFARFATAQVTRPPAVLAEWLEDAKAWIKLAKGFALANHWPMNDKHCAMCEFRRVCAVSPSHRESWLRDEFEKREWNPLRARGDI